MFLEDATMRKTIREYISFQFSFKILAFLISTNHSVLSCKSIVYSFSQNSLLKKRQLQFIQKISYNQKLHQQVQQIVKYLLGNENTSIKEETLPVQSKGINEGVSACKTPEDGKQFGCKFVAFHNSSLVHSSTSETTASPISLGCSSNCRSSLSYLESCFQWFFCSYPTK